MPRLPGTSVPATLGEPRVRRAALATLFIVLLLGSKSALSLLLLPVCLRRLGAEQAGVWLLLQTVWNHLFLAEMGLGQIVMNAAGQAYARREFEAVRRIFTTSALLLAALAGVVAAGAFALLWAAPVERWLLTGSEGGRQLFRANLLLLVPLAALRLPAGAVSGLLSGMRDHHWRTGLELVQPVAVFAASYAVLAAGGGVRSLVWVTAVATILTSYAGLWVIRRRHGFLRFSGAHFDAGRAREFAHLMLDYSPLLLCLSLQRTIPMFVVSRFLTVAAVPRIYLLVMTFRVLLLFALDAVSKGLQPYVICFEARGERATTRFYWMLTTRLVAALAAAALPAVLPLYNRFAAAWLGSQYAVDDRVVLVFALLFVVEAALSAGANFTLALGRFRSLASIWLATAALSAGLAVAGVLQTWTEPLFGLALGLLLAQLFCALPFESRLFAQILGLRPAAYARAALARPALALGGALLLCYGSVPLYTTLGASPWWQPASLAALLSLLAAALSARVLAPAERLWVSRRAGVLCAHR